MELLKQIPETRQCDYCGRMKHDPLVKDFFGTDVYFCDWLCWDGVLTNVIGRGVRISDGKEGVGLDSLRRVYYERYHHQAEKDKLRDWARSLRAKTGPQKT